jgi:hypothetical protein
MAELMSCCAKPGGYCARRYLIQYAGHIESCALVGQHGEGFRWVGMRPTQPSEQPTELQRWTRTHDAGHNHAARVSLRRNGGQLVMRMYNSNVSPRRPALQTGQRTPPPLTNRRAHRRTSARTDGHEGQYSSEVQQRPHCSARSASCRCVRASVNKATNGSRAEFRTKRSQVQILSPRPVFRLVRTHLDSGARVDHLGLSD